MVWLQHTMGILYDRFIVPDDCSHLKAINKEVKRHTLCRGTGNGRPASGCVSSRSVCLGYHYGSSHVHRASCRHQRQLAYHHHR